MAKVTVEELEYCIDCWHDSDSKQGVREYLGMTPEQFHYWRTEKKVPEGWKLSLQVKRLLGK